MIYKVYSATSRAVSQHNKSSPIGLKPGPLLLKLEREEGTHTHTHTHTHTPLSLSLTHTHNHIHTHTPLSRAQVGDRRVT